LYHYSVYFTDKNETIIKIEAYILKKKCYLGDSIEMECFATEVTEAFGSYITFCVQFDSYDDPVFGK
jgi:hypothetical protein